MLSVVPLKRLNNRPTHVIPAKVGIQRVCTVDSVSSMESVMSVATGTTKDENRVCASGDKV
jgi:hypothetical protein